MSASVQPVGIDVTVKVGLVANWPPTVTTKGADGAPAGTIATILVSLQLATPAFVPFNDTVLMSCVVPKPDPVIVTYAPTIPDWGEMLVTLGAAKERAEIIAHPHTTQRERQLTCICILRGRWMPQDTLV
jgi:hypothetical protein